MPSPLATGIAIGPFALGWIPDSEEERYLAEFGVVFLMFSIGLEFSLPRLHTVLVTPGAAAVGRSLEELALDELLVDVVAIRRQGGQGGGTQARYPNPGWRRAGAARRRRWTGGGGV